MTEKDIEKISEQYKDEKAPLYDKIHGRVEQVIAQQANRRKRLKAFNKFFPMSLAIVLVICLAIVLPVVLQPANDPSVRYSSNDLSSELLDCTLKDYATIINEEYLYIDLPDMAEIITLRFFDKGDNSATAYLQERFDCEEKECTVELSIVKHNITVDKYEDFVKIAKEININGVSITYVITTLNSKAQFEYKGYKYYLEFDSAIEMDFLEEIINNMFNTEQATA